MPLVNFGSILGFAEEIEKQQFEFCIQALQNAACVDVHPLLETLAKMAKKRVAEVQRIRRENVTEMILESIEGFVRDPFIIETRDAAALDATEAVAHVRQMGQRAMNYYEQAAEKLKGQAEVSRALKGLKKKHTKDQKSF